MAKSRVYKRSAGGGAITFNMTPMIDVTFQLILFFILAGQMASAELASLVLHEPTESVASEDPALMQANKIVVNVTSIHGANPDKATLADSGDAKAYKVRGREFPARTPAERSEAHAALAKILKAARDAAPEPTKFIIEVRADKRVSYRHIWPVLDMASQANIAKVNVTALLERE